jgi:uncharacterized DUF497 family protein
MPDLFDWDDGNWPKCGKHGLAKMDIELILTRRSDVTFDPSTDEVRFRAVGAAGDGRMAFVVFTIRERDGRKLIRPISARYMHAREKKRYVETKAEAVSGLQH